MIGYIWVKLLTKLQGAGIRDSVISPKAKVESGSIAIHSNMGKYSYCGRHCLLSNVEIGNFCSIGDRVVIGGGNTSSALGFYLSGILQRAG